MQVYKFLITTQDSNCIKQHPHHVFESTEASELRVVQCKFPDASDNMVDYHDRNGEKFSLMVDIEGIFFYPLNILSKEDIIRSFE